MDVLHHHHCAVHQNAEVDGANRQQVGGNVPQVETDERETERQRNRRGDDQSRSDVHQEEHQHHDHQHDAAHQIVLDRARGERDQITTVVEGVNLHVLRQHMLIHVSRHGSHMLEHHLRLFADAQQDDSLHRIVSIVEPKLTQTRCLPDLDPADVLHQHRHAVLCRDHDVRYIGECRNAPESANIIELSALTVESTAGVGVVAAEC